MKNLLVVPLLAFVLVACETTNVNDSSKKDLIIARGMPISEVVSMLGEPESIESDLEVGGVKMDSWHYEIIVSKVSEYQEVDTYIEPDSPKFRMRRPVDMVDNEAIETILVEVTTTQIMDILVYGNRVFKVQGEVKVTSDKEDWRD